MKKKILYFVPQFPGLTETFIEREISKLVEFGNLDVHVLSLVPGKGVMSEATKKITVYHRINIWDLFLASFYFLTRTNEVIQVFKLVNSDTSMSLPKRKYFFLKILGYTKVIESFKPDQIHAHFLADPSTIAMAASIILHVPFSISAHAKDVFVEGTLLPQKAKAAKFISICNGYAWKKCIELAGLDINNSSQIAHIHKIYHGLDSKKLFAGEAKMTKPNRPVIFVGSRLVEKKGLKYAIEASKILKDRDIAHEMHIVGPGPMYAELVAQVNTAGLQNNVFIPGDGKGLPNAEIMEYFKISDIFAHPSIETGEGDVDGVPTFVIEAALRGLPIVTTTAGSITDLIDESDGLLVSQRNSAELATAIEKLIYDVDMRKRLGSAAKARAEEMFNIDRNIGELEKLFLE